MTWASSEDNTRLRARQLLRFYNKHQDEGPIPYAAKITASDIELAESLAPVWRLEDCDEGEKEYPEQWEKMAKSLSFTLGSFRRKAKEITTAPTFIGDNGDKAQIAYLELLNKRLKELLKEANEEKKADRYLARAEKVEAQLEKLLEELEEEDEKEDEE
ncbi:hypothetical protein BFJ66_g8370 [Fusarium oxysporum f. sp. cepae]|uniref:Uncharacterized protein n=1 Tax=Fusarium oxysporum f. sp. cepae TaxID=396571 RepID=A0A3L6MU69_FUSOX|nr:hypothetical protein BFJ65_g17268 [Fusarium oxysporum f. sp. cepae]RKK46796.1 hypothetical protein BFJ66_g8370 [Fusarium oxysporum f. sp. cepae]RKK49194.1 hypothetical protein BFJ67_g6959 [Fusarium oxysporum f. sp. cepae]